MQLIVYPLSVTSLRTKSRKGCDEQSLSILIVGNKLNANSLRQELRPLKVHFTRFPEKISECSKYLEDFAHLKVVFAFIHFADQLWLNMRRLGVLQEERRFWLASGTFEGTHGRTSKHQLRKGLLVAGVEVIMLPSFSLDSVVTTCALMPWATLQHGGRSMGAPGDTGEFV